VFSNAFFRYWSETFFYLYFPSFLTKWQKKMSAVQNVQLLLQNEDCNVFTTARSRIFSFQFVNFVDRYI
jgi:hypothetical protein